MRLKLNVAPNLRAGFGHTILYYTICGICNTVQRFDKKKKKTEKKLWNSKVLCSPKFPQQFTCFFTVYAEEKKENESNFVRYAFPIIGSEKNTLK